MQFLADVIVIVAVLFIDPHLLKTLLKSVPSSTAYTNLMYSLLFCRFLVAQSNASVVFLSELKEVYSVYSWAVHLRRVDKKKVWEIF